MNLNKFDVFLGDKLKELMNSKGIGQDELGELVSVSQNTLSLLINGKTKKPSASVVFKLAAILGVHPYYFFGINKNDPIIPKDMQQVLVHKDDLLIVNFANDVRAKGKNPNPYIKALKHILDFGDSE